MARTAANRRAVCCGKPLAAGTVGSRFWMPGGAAAIRTPMPIRIAAAAICAAAVAAAAGFGVASAAAEAAEAEETGKAAEENAAKAARKKEDRGEAAGSAGENEKEDREREAVEAIARALASADAVVVCAVKETPKKRGSAEDEEGVSLEFAFECREAIFGKSSHPDVGEIFRASVGDRATARLLEDRAGDGRPVLLLLWIPVESAFIPRRNDLYLLSPPPAPFPPAVPPEPARKQGSVHPAAVHLIFDSDSGEKIVRPGFSPGRDGTPMSAVRAAAAELARCVIVPCVRVDGLLEGSQGEARGMKSGDFILSYDGRGPLADMGDVLMARDQAMNDPAKAGADIEVVLEREGRRVRVTLKPGPLGAYLSTGHRLAPKSEAAAPAVSDRRSFPPLVPPVGASSGASKDASAEDRARAAGVEAAADAGAAGKIEALIRRLDDDDFFAREKAQKDLEAVGTPAVPYLERAAREGNAEVAMRARAALGRVRAASVSGTICLVLSRPESGPANLGEAWVLDARTREARAIPGSFGSLNSAALAPDGFLALYSAPSAAAAFDLFALDVRTGKRYRLTRSHYSSVAGLAFDPDGRRASFSASRRDIGKVGAWTWRSGRVRLDMVSGRVEDPTAEGRAVEGAARDRKAGGGEREGEGKGGGEEAEAREEDVLAGRDGIAPVRFSPDGKRLAARGFDEMGAWLGVRDVGGDAQAREIYRPRHGSAIQGFCWSPDGSHLAVAETGTGNRVVVVAADGAASVVLKEFDRPIIGDVTWQP